MNRTPETNGATGAAEKDGKALGAGPTAQAWAQAHPDFAGLLVLETLAPKGTGGRRGLMRRDLRYFVAGGRAAAARTVTDPGTGSRWDRENAQNGRCVCCGKVWVAPVLRERFTLDPEAGHAVPREYHRGYQFLPGRAALSTIRSFGDFEPARQQGTPVLWHPWAAVGRACPACVTELGLVSGGEGRELDADRSEHSEAGLRIYVQRYHPTLCRFGPPAEERLKLR